MEPRIYDQLPSYDQLLPAHDQLLKKQAMGELLFPTSMLKEDMTSMTSFSY